MMSSPNFTKLKVTAGAEEMFRMLPSSGHLMTLSTMGGETTLLLSVCIIASIRSAGKGLLRISEHNGSIKHIPKKSVSVQLNLT